MIAIENLTYRIQKKRILKDINLQIKRGEFWLIFGPNGAGKTTLLKIFGGLLRNYSGQTRLDGVDIPRIPKKQLARKISYLPQFEEISLPLSVAEILLSGRYPYTSLFRGYSGHDRDRVARAADQLDLTKFLNRDINTLSGGERKKVMLASAFIQDVDLILLDEPYTFLDPRAISNLNRNLEMLHGQGKTLVIVSHSIETLFPLVTHMAALKRGKLVYAGKKRFRKQILKETYGINFSRLALENREIIYIDE
jgi:iron complex transport system ATP-binding protein